MNKYLIAVGISLFGFATAASAASSTLVGTAGDTLTISCAAGSTFYQVLKTGGAGTTITCVAAAPAKPATTTPAPTTTPTQGSGSGNTSGSPNAKE